jgi:6-phosphogluconate dehydrogenase
MGQTLTPQWLRRSGAETLAQDFNKNLAKIGNAKWSAQKESVMQIGMIGLGRMGANMVRRLLAAGHECVAHDMRPEAVNAVMAFGARGATTLDEFVAQLRAPRVVWLMLPAAVVDSAIESLLPLLEPEDIVIDGGNSNFRDDRRRAVTLASRGLRYIDVGTSGGVWGLDNGYCLMIGGDASTVTRLESVFDALAPASGSSPPAKGREDRGPGAQRGWLHCGGSGAGHFVKMVHNGIEYGLMAAYAEGFEILRKAGTGSESRAADAESAPLANPETYCYSFDIAEIAELWRRGSVVRSWLLDLLAQALLRDPTLEELSSRVADSGEGRWTLQAAIDLGAPTPVLASALMSRFSSQGGGEFTGRIVSALRRGFGGHEDLGRGR